MTTKLLRSYRSICAEIEDLEEKSNHEDEEHYVGDTVPSGSRFPWNVRNVHIAGYEYDYDGDVSSQLKLAKLKERKKHIEKFVESISEYNLLKAVTLYYIEPIEDGEDKPKWEDVVDKVGNGETSGSLKTSLNRELKKFNKKRNKCNECNTCNKSVC